MTVHEDNTLCLTCLLATITIPTVTAGLNLTTAETMTYALGAQHSINNPTHVVLTTMRAYAPL